MSKGGVFLFHPGKVLKVLKNNDKTVFGADQTIMATISMWDENLLTVGVEPGLGEKIREGDVVLIDYGPKYQTIPVPRQIIVKILRGETAKKVWKHYEEKNQTRKSLVEESPIVPNHNVR
ncbi:hypothetical protein KKE06_03190 [Candidatus Micrarchaeota archaeon]|nr:hypothetical protein [Candidatus Micrarchaeota archaeon]